MDVKEKIEKIIKAENLNFAQFAAQINIQGSTLSHILNGRNKPSLDVLKSILNRYRNISSDWLILDVGTMYREEKQSQEPTLFDNIEQTISPTVSLEAIEAPKSIPPIYTNQEKVVPNVLSQQQPTPEPSIITPLQSTVLTSDKAPSKSVRKIIIYYTDNTFQEFEGQ
jgi:transcriptional regulator with XRE-family HTH domain